MISDTRGGRKGRALLWALILSIGVHAVLLPLILWLTLLDFTNEHNGTQRELIVSSTSVRIERRTVAQPRSLAQPQPRAANAQAPRAAAASAPHELARSAPHASPQPSTAPKRPSTQSSLEQTLAQQQAQFAREAAQLHAQNNPLSVATAAPNAGAPKQYHMDVAGVQGTNPGEGYLFPVRTWRDGTNTCYYGRYLWEYPDGSSENAAIPWPFCYARGQDPIAAGLRHFPFPLPPSGYVAPPGTYLAPEVHKIYTLWLEYMRTGGQ